MDVQQTTINAVRILSAEAIQKAKSGHPGLPMGSAPIGYTLFQNFLKFNPREPGWDDRDRFILSAGHGSMLDYSLLYLYGYDLKKEDLMNFRQLGSKTPGHPEYGHTAGVETTTGPLGQGIANGVGMALAEAHLAAKYNKPGFPVVDHYTYVLCGDGCLEEGISYEACSFAGTHALGKLILIYDDNDITIEGDTDVTFKENVGARFAAQNWQVLHVDLVTDPDNVEAVSDAIEKAKARADKPSIIICHTKIGYGSPLEGSEKCHGAPLGEENLQKTKEKLGWPCEEAFDCPKEVFEHCQIAAGAGAEKEMQWKKMFAEYEYAYPELAEEYKAAMAGKKPELETMEELFAFDKPMATRQTSAIVLNKLAAVMPQLMGGSADLAPSNLSDMKDTDEIKYGTFAPDSYEGRNIHFGIREHAMAAIANGMQLHGGIPVSYTHLQARHAAGGAHEYSRHVHHDARFHRRRRGRPHARARRTADLPAFDPRHEGLPSRGRQGNGGGMDFRAQRHPAHRAGAYPSEPAPIRSQRPCRAQGRLRSRGLRRNARRSSHRLGLRGGAVRKGEGRARRKEYQRPRRLHALHRGI